MISESENLHRVPRLKPCTPHKTDRKRVYIFFVFNPKSPTVCGTQNKKLPGVGRSGLHTAGSLVLWLESAQHTLTRSRKSSFTFVTLLDDTHVLIFFNNLTIFLFLKNF